MFCIKIWVGESQPDSLKREGVAVVASTTHWRQLLGETNA